MPPKREKEPVNVVNLDGDDGGAPGGVGGLARSVPTNQMTSQAGATPQTALSPVALSAAESGAIASRSFWKAGAYEINTSTWSAPVEGQLEHARVHPKFLHSNATSHKWAFGAIAELLDNAVDEVHNGATFVKVDKIDIMKDNSPALLIQDDGGGMNPEGIRKCMSLGYSSKKTNTTIGQYGNGFKTSTMRLGADVIVFTRATRKGKATQSVGLLSYTFLRRTGQDDVIVPMIDFDVSGHWAEPIVYSSQDDWSDNLKTILEWSPFVSKEELMLQFEDIGTHGTKIIIFNLWLNDEGIYELNFDDDDEDIRLRDEAINGGSKLTKKAMEIQSHISYRIRYSLRAYASLLYLKKFENFNIILRGKNVKQYNVVDDLKYVKVVTYRPQVTTPSKEVTVETTIGFVKEAPELNVSGFNVYHKNRLIRPFWKVTADGSSKGNGVVGVLEANFIEPAHDKQDFERSSLYIRLETKLKQMVMEYWKGHCHLVGYQPIDSSLRKLQKESSVQPHNAANQHINKPLISLPPNIGPDMTNEQPGSEQRVNPQVPFKDVISVDGPESMSVEQLCEENIQLFMKCEEYRQKEAELNQAIDDLERELEEARRKCGQLAAHLENKKKQQNLKQQSGVFR